MQSRGIPSAPRYRSTAGIAVAVVVLLALNIPTAIASIWNDFQQADLIDTMQAAHNGEPGSERLSDADLEAHDSRAASIALMWTGVYLATALFFATWFRRMYTNLPALGTTDPKYTPGWAMGAWFVPFINLVRPLEIAQELWAGSAPSATPPPPPVPVESSVQLGGAELEETRVARRDERIRSRARSASSGLLKVWWGCWIGWNAFGVLAQKLEGSALESLERVTDDAGYSSAMESFRTATQVMTAADASDIPMVILAIFVVRALDGRQREKAAAMANRGGGSPIDGSHGLTEP